MNNILNFEEFELNEAVDHSADVQDAIKKAESYLKGPTYEPWATSLMKEFKRVLKWANPEEAKVLNQALRVYNELKHSR